MREISLLAAFMLDKDFYFLVFAAIIWLLGFFLNEATRLYIHGVHFVHC